MFTESVNYKAWIKAVTHFPPVPTNAPKASVHAFAEQVAERLSFGPGDPLEPLVARLGGRIEYRTPVVSHGRLPESIVVEGTRKFTIYVASITSPERDRFTIAHELGHLSPLSVSHSAKSWGRYGGNSLGG